MIKNKKEIEYFPTYSEAINEATKLQIRLKIIKTIFISIVATALIFGGILYFFRDYNSSEVKNNFIVITSEGVSEINGKEVNKIGEIVIHKGVYINKGIIDAIDEKFSKEEAKKLKVILLAECAKDYKIDGVANYECKSTTSFRNTDGSWDCGYLQINQKTKCTAESYSIKYQVEKAYNKLHSLESESCGGWDCWSSYKFRNSPIIKTSYNHWASK